MSHPTIFRKWAGQRISLPWGVSSNNDWLCVHSIFNSVSIKTIYWCIALNTIHLNIVQGMVKKCWKSMSPNVANVADSVAVAALEVPRCSWAQSPAIWACWPVVLHDATGIYRVNPMFPEFTPVCDGFFNPSYLFVCYWHWWLKEITSISNNNSWLWSWIKLPWRYMHVYICLYIYMCVCVRVCFFSKVRIYIHI